jgi:hypothetical protein
VSKVWRDARKPVVVERDVGSFDGCLHFSASTCQALRLMHNPTQNRSPPLMRVHKCSQHHLPMTLQARATCSIGDE